MNATLTFCTAVLAQWNRLTKGTGMNKPMVRLERFDISGFRSCRKVVFAPRPDLSVLIGLNGSGKSNILQAMLLPRQISRHGFRAPRRASEATCSLLIEYRVGKQPVKYKAALSYSFDDRGNEEISRPEESWQFPGIGGINGWIAIPSGITGEFGPYPRRYSKELFLRNPRGRMMVGYSLPNIPQLPKIFPLIECISKFNREITYYSAAVFTDPSRCPNFFEIENDETMRSSYVGSSRHRQFLYDLYTMREERRSEYEEFMSIVGKRGIGLIDRIAWKKIKVLAREVAVRAGGKIVRKKKEGLLIIPTMIVKGLRVGPSQLSEGTFKSLALLYYLISDNSPLMLVEEPEVCVHHGLLTNILEVIKSCVSRKQIIFSTHSEFALDSILPEQVYLVRYLAASGTRIQPLSKSMSERNYLALKTYLNTTGNLGEYLRHGGASL